MALSAGTRLGPYEIQSALGAGGMGEVYRARDTRLDRTVAIKILPEALAADPQFRERFDREARTISQLDHPHICALYDVGEQAPSAGSGQAVAYLVMQYLDGETLANRIQKAAGAKAPALQAPALQVEEALTIAIQIAGALDTAHRAGKRLGSLSPPEDTGLTSPQLAPDGQRVAVFRTTAGNFDVWLVDVARGNWNRFTFDPAIDVTPVWSPDGRRIVFSSNRSGNYQIFEKPADGSGDEQALVATPTNKQPRDWRSDGRFLLYTQQDPKTASDLWALPMEGDRRPFPVAQTAFDEVHGQFSPGGRWVAYASNETGRYEVYVRPFPEGGGRGQVSTAGGIYPRWCRDARELFYIAMDNTLMAVSLQIGADARTINPGTPVALFQTQLATRANVGIGGFASAPQYAVAADGRFLLNVVASDAAVSPITLILNWTALLPK